MHANDLHHDYYFKIKVYQVQRVKFHKVQVSKYRY